MRSHILQCMDLENDKELPVSYDEKMGKFIPKDEPVRFIWDQTTRKCPHNNRMKKRVVLDMQANKSLYPLVPAEDFTKPKLESVFEQAFTTLRQKFATQSGAAPQTDTKAQRSRRVGRKKTVSFASLVSLNTFLIYYIIQPTEAS